MSERYRIKSGQPDHLLLHPRSSARTGAEPRAWGFVSQLVKIDPHISSPEKIRGSSSHLILPPY
jgi:hypothetical protein